MPSEPTTETLTGRLPLRLYTAAVLAVGPSKNEGIADDAKERAFWAPPSASTGEAGPLLLAGASAANDAGAFAAMLAMAVAAPLVRVGFGCG